MARVSDIFKNILTDYKIWKTNSNFYNNNHDSVDIEYFSKLPCFHYSEVEAINKCNSNVIVIDNITESIHSKIYFRQYSNDKHYIIFTGGTWDKDKHDIGVKSYDIVYQWFFLIEMIDTYMSPHRFCFYFNKTYDFQYPKTHTFFSTIGNVRNERDIVVENIINAVVYKNYILRYSGEDLAMPSDHLDIVSFVSGEFDPYTDIIPEYYHNVSQSLPIDIYNSSYLKLVVETDIVENNCFFITEKTVKALITGIPFIIVSTPFFLKILQDNGFKTYNTLWDESYDSILDYKMRISAISDLLNSLEHFDWQRHKKELQDIANHNLQNLINLNKIMNDFFINFENVVEKYNERRC